MISRRRRCCSRAMIILRSATERPAIYFTALITRQTNGRADGEMNGDVSPLHSRRPLLRPRGNSPWKTIWQPLTPRLCNTLSGDSLYRDLNSWDPLNLSTLALHGSFRETKFKILMMQDLYFVSVPYFRKSFISLSKFSCPHNFSNYCIIYDPALS